MKRDFFDFLKKCVELLRKLMPSDEFSEIENTFVIITDELAAMRDNHAKASKKYRDNHGDNHGKSSDNHAGKTCEISSKMQFLGENHVKNPSRAHGSRSILNNNLLKRPSTVRTVTVQAEEKNLNKTIPLNSKKQESYAIPERLEMFKYAKSKGYTEEHFFDWHDMNEDFGWVDKSGVKIKNWRAALDGYVRKRTKQEERT